MIIELFYIHKYQYIFFVTLIQDNYLSALASEILVYPSGGHIFACANYSF